MKNHLALVLCLGLCSPVFAKTPIVNTQQLEKMGQGPCGSNDALYGEVVVGKEPVEIFTAPQQEAILGHIEEPVFVCITQQAFTTPGVGQWSKIRFQAAAPVSDCEGNELCANSIDQSLKDNRYWFRPHRATSTSVMVTSGWVRTSDLDVYSNGLIP